ncbi:MAG: hypothetical protein LR000_00820 [Candidatus Pacebacteria bacterium]|nr:hypothetical protein [Candidatus Paceibacterota bacterium]
MLPKTKFKIGIVVILIIFLIFLVLQFLSHVISPNELQKPIVEATFQLYEDKIEPELITIKPNTLLFCKFISMSGNHLLKFLSAPEGLQGREISFSLSGETKTITLNIPKDFTGEYVFQVIHQKENKILDGKIIIK